MINRQIAQEYINTLAKFPTYEISIYGVHGNLLGSTSPHKHSYDETQLIDFIHSSESLFQSKRGKSNFIWLKVFDDKKIACCIEVAAEDNNILPYATALKMSLEIRIKYDKIQIKEQKTLTLHEQLIQELVSNHPHADKIFDLCEQTHRSINIPRRLILLIPDDKTNLDTLINMNLHFDSNEDIIGRLNETLFILKDMTNAKGKNNYTSIYLDFLIKNTSFRGMMLIGFTANKYTQVHSYYENLLWLKTYISNNCLKENKFFFKDYIDSYFLSQISFECLESLFGSINWDEETSEEFIQTTDALIQNNYNIVRSSKELFVHKNTLMYRLSKFKKELDIDPINSEADRTYVKLLNYYLKQLPEKKGGDAK